jgi:hypothetical protein
VFSVEKPYRKVSDNFIILLVLKFSCDALLPESLLMSFILNYILNHLGMFINDL